MAKTYDYENLLTGTAIGLLIKARQFDKEKLDASRVDDFINTLKKLGDNSQLSKKEKIAIDRVLHVDRFPLDLTSKLIGKGQTIQTQFSELDRQMHTFLRQKAHNEPIAGMKFPSNINAEVVEIVKLISENQVDLQKTILTELQKAALAKPEFSRPEALAVLMQAFEDTNAYFSKEIELENTLSSSKEMEEITAAPPKSASTNDNLEPSSNTSVVELMELAYAEMTKRGLKAQTTGMWRDVYKTWSSLVKQFSDNPESAPLMEKYQALQDQLRNAGRYSTALDKNETALDEFVSKDIQSLGTDPSPYEINLNLSMATNSELFKDYPQLNTRAQEQAATFKLIHKAISKIDNLRDLLIKKTSANEFQDYGKTMEEELKSYAESYNITASLAEKVTQQVADYTAKGFAEIIKHEKNIAKHHEKLNKTLIAVEKELPKVTLVNYDSIERLLGKAEKELEILRGLGSEQNTTSSNFAELKKSLDQSLMKLTEKEVENFSSNFDALKRNLLIKSNTADHMSFDKMITQFTEDNTAIFIRHPMLGDKFFKWVETANTAIEQNLNFKQINSSNYPNAQDDRISKWLPPPLPGIANDSVEAVQKRTPPPLPKAVPPPLPKVEPPSLPKAVPPPLPKAVPPPLPKAVPPPLPKAVPPPLPKAVPPPLPKMQASSNLKKGPPSLPENHVDKENQPHHQNSPIGHYFELNRTAKQKTTEPLGGFKVDLGSIQKKLGELKPHDNRYKKPN